MSDSLPRAGHVLEISTSRFELALTRLSNRLFGRWLRHELYNCMVLRGSDASAKINDACLVDDKKSLAGTRLDYEDLTRAASDPELHLPGDFLRSFSYRTDLSIGIYSGHDLVAYAFFSREPTPVAPGLTFSWKGNWIYVYKVFCRPAWRGRRLAAFCMREGMRHLQSNEWIESSPIEGFVALVHPWNTGSMRAFTRMGYQTLGRFADVSLGNFRFAAKTTADQFTLSATK